jgi:hypothetical protein
MWRVERVRGRGQGGCNRDFVGRFEDDDDTTMTAERIAMGRKCTRGRGETHAKLFLAESSVNSELSAANPDLGSPAMQECGW